MSLNRPQPLDETMWTLGIESSCDETAAALIDPAGVLRASEVFSQDTLHARFGGVVPELASREHLEKIQVIVEQAFKTAGIGPAQLGGVAVTHGPGLIGSLLVGVSFAKALAYAHGLPLVGVNHLEGHLLAPFVDADPPTFPLVALLVSGGHTSIYLARSLGEYQCVGSTLDDAAGEAFDKVAKLMGLGYPGGARIDALAKLGNPEAIPFPRGLDRKGNFDFSFSGLKTAVLTWLRRHQLEGAQPDVAASFQRAVVDILVKKTLAAAAHHKVSHVVVSGGVAANSELRARFETACAARKLRLSLAARRLCTDNAAMIAYAGRWRLMAGQRHPWTLGTDARLLLR